MTTPTTTSEQSRQPQPWWVQAALFSVGATIINCVILASARYPSEHWPMAAAIIVITAFATGICSDAIILFVSHRLRIYRNAVLTKHNLDWETTDLSTQRYRSLIMSISAALTLSYAAATWGTALYTFRWMAQLGNLPPITDTVHSAGLIALIAGASTIIALLLLSFGMVGLVDRLSDPEKPVPSIIRGVYQIARFTTATNRQPLPSFILKLSQAT